MELYEQIRREYEFGAGTIMGIARKLGVHRRMVRDAVRSATPGYAKPCSTGFTDQAHIIETGSESYRFRRTRSKKQKPTSIEKAVEMTV